MSATLSPELDKFKKIVLHNPAILKLEESTSVGHLLQFYLELTESDKFLVLYVFIKLGLLQGNIITVNIIITAIITTTLTTTTTTTTTTITTTTTTTTIATNTYTTTPKR